MPEVYVTIPNIPVTLRRKNSPKALRAALMEVLGWIADSPSEVVCWVHKEEVVLENDSIAAISIEEIDIKGGKQNATGTT